MQKVPLGRSGLTVTRLGMGGCPLGGHGWGPTDHEDLVSAIRAAIGEGIEFFDTADVYGLGRSENLLAEILGPDRHKVVLASKFGVRAAPGEETRIDVSPEYARSALEASLERLRIDYLPLYYAHWPDGVTPVEETVLEMDRFRKEGKIGALGLSNYSASDIEQACRVTQIDAVQVQFNLVDQREARELFEVVEKHRLSLITWGSLAQGMLSGKYDRRTRFGENDRRSRYDNFQGEKYVNNLEIVDRVRCVADKNRLSCVQVAIRWLLDTPPVSSVLFGAKNRKQVLQNASAETCRLSAEDYALLDRASRDSAAAVPGREKIIDDFEDPFDRDENPVTTTSTKTP